MALPITRILRNLAEKLIDFYENPSKKVPTKKQAEAEGRDVQRAYSEWLRRVAELGDNLLELPPNSIIVSPSTPDGDFQIIDNGTLGYVLTSNGTTTLPSFQPVSGGGGVWGTITGTVTGQLDLITYLNGEYVPLIRNITINGITQDLSLDRTWTITNFQPNISSFPITGNLGVLYIANDTGLIYRWGGSSYLQIGGGSTVWGGISGTLSDQIDLQNALDDKADELITSFTSAPGVIVDGDTLQESIEKLDGNFNKLLIGNKLFNFYNFR